MKKELTVAAALTSWLGCCLPAQNVVYHGNQTPNVGSLNAYPLGKVGIRVQQLIPGTLFGGVPTLINDIYFNSAPWTSGVATGSQIYYDD
ncbi:MAG: hypothetical protein KAI24_02575, partial [Planctomycetes bacterium]|nr:hypothetical protein [Planctomycetota bacterium]